MLVWLLQAACLILIIIDTRIITFTLLDEAAYENSRLKLIIGVALIYLASFSSISLAYTIFTETSHYWHQ